MKVLLFFLCVLFAVYGVIILDDSVSAIHEIEAFILFVISSLFLCSALVIDAIDKLRSSNASVTRSDEYENKLSELEQVEI